MPDRRGVVTISLDTELAWGCFDTVGVETHQPAYEHTRSVICRLCTLLSGYRIPATWAVVAHLLDDCPTGRDPHSNLPDPRFDWINDWYGSLPCRTDVDRNLWFAPDVVEMVQRCDPPQEIGLHGYSHMILGEDVCCPAAADAEIERAISVFREAGLRPESFIFPRNYVGYRNVLRDHGINVYRAPNAEWVERTLLPDPIKKGGRWLTEATVSTPPVVTPITADGLTGVPGSQVFRPYHDGWQYTPADSQLKRARKGIEQAAATGKIFHLWFHPFNLALEPDRLLNAFEGVLDSVAKARDRGRIEVLTLSEIDTQFNDGRWR